MAGHRTTGRALPWLAAVFAPLAMLVGVAPAAAQTSTPTPPTYQMPLMPPGVQTAPPRKSDGDKQHFTTAQAQAALEKFSDCLVKNPRTRAMVKTFIRTIPGSPAYFQTGQALAIGECVPVERGPSRAGFELRIMNDTMRAAAFGSLFRREFGARAATDLGPLPALLLSAAFDGPIDQISADFRGRLALGDCVVRAVPVHVRDLLLAAPGSSAETTQFGQIVPALQGCLTVDQTLTFDKYELRGLLAEAIYALELAYARANPVQKAGTKG